MIMAVGKVTKLLGGAGQAGLGCHQIKAPQGPGVRMLAWRRGMALACTAWLLMGGHAMAAAELDAASATARAAMATAKARLDAAPEVPEAHVDLALALARTPFVEACWASFTEAQQRDPSLPARLAERWAAQAAAAPRDPEPRFRLAFAYWMQGDRAAARRQFEAAAALAPQDAWPMAHLGLVWDAEGQGELARAAWQRAASLDPSNALAQYLLAQAHFRQGRFSQAAEALATAQRLRARYGDTP